MVVRPPSVSPTSVEPSCSPAPTSSLADALADWRACKTDSRSCSSNCAALVSAIKDPPSKSAPSSPRAPRTSILGQPEMAVCPSCKLDCAVSIGHDPVFWGTQAKVLHVAGVTGGLLSNLGGFLIRIRIPCIVHVSCMYRERILMCPVHIHQDTTGYNKIHLQIRTSLDTIEIQCISTVHIHQDTTGYNKIQSSPLIKKTGILGLP
jgi:hypothetical protein